MACDPQALANASRCISQCIPEGQQLPALISLFCTIADNGGGGGGGSGTVTSFSAGNLSPLFTTSVANPTTTPALSFSLTAQANNTVFAGPNGGGPLAPTFRALVVADVSDLGAGVGTFLISPTKGNFHSCVVGTTGTDLVVFSDSPTLNNLIVLGAGDEAARFDKLGGGGTPYITIGSDAVDGVYIIKPSPFVIGFGSHGFPQQWEMSGFTSNFSAIYGVYVCQGSVGLTQSVNPLLVATLEFVGGIFVGTT